MAGVHQDQWLEVNGLRHHLDVWDGGGDLTVLLLHGYLDLGRNWSFFVEALPEGLDWHLVAPDWRGHGDTEWVGRGGYYHFVDYVRDLDRIAAAVRRRRLVVVGHSMGCTVLGLWLGARPGAAEAYVMVEGLGPPGLAPDAYPQRLAAWLDDTAPFDTEPFDTGRFDRPMESLADAMRRLRRSNPRLPEGQAERLAAYATRRCEDGLLRWRYDPLHRTRSPVPLLPEVNAAFWRRIAAPGLWVGGAESPWHGEAIQRRLDALPHLQRRVLSGAGHMVQNDAPEALASEVFEFLARLQ